MGSYYIPRDTKGEGRILYIFSKKGLIYTVIGIGVGAFIKWILNTFGDIFPKAYGTLNFIGIIFLVIFALIGFAIGTFKVPAIDKFEITKKAAGIDIDVVIKEYIKYLFKKDKIYIFDTTDLVKEQLEKEEAKKELEQKLKEKAMKKGV